MLLAENVTVSLASHDVDLSSQNDVMRCVWSGGEIERMEWLFIGQDTIVPMMTTNSSWDGAIFTCTTQRTKLKVKGIADDKSPLVLIATSTA